MRIDVLQIITLGVWTCWLLCGQQAIAQENTIVYTALRNPSPGGLFSQEFGVPVYGGLRSGPFSALPLDLNEDGIVDYQVLAPFGGNWGFALEGMGENTVWTRPTGGNDVGGFIRPLLAGAQIGESLPASDEWMDSWRVAWNTNLVVAPTLSAYSSISTEEGIGLFRNMTAFVGLKFVLGTNVHFGWIMVQEIPWLNGGGIVYSYAYESRPNTAILAGAGIDSDNDGVWDLVDQCSDTPAGEVVNADGCSISQLVPCDGPWKNHGQYIVRVIATVAQFQRHRLITKAEARVIVKEAARSDCGKQRVPRDHHDRIDCER